MQYNLQQYPPQMKCCPCSITSHVQLFVTPQTAAHQAPLSYIISQSSFKFMSIELVMLSNHLILCYPLLLLPLIFFSTGSFPVS